MFPLFSFDFSIIRGTTPNDVSQTADLDGDLSDSDSECVTDNENNISNVKGFTVTHLNIRSLKNKIPDLEVLLTTKKINVLTLSETWLHPNIENTILALPTYNLFRNDRTRASKGGGVAAYVNTDFTCDNQIYSHLNFSLIESQVLLIKKPNNKSTIIVNIYRPPQGDKDQFLQYITQILHEITEDRYADLYITEDVNLDHLPENKLNFTSQFEHVC